jgi:GR25 family glycosyltransferase involved in LPS biosynthesis
MSEPVIYVIWCNEERKRFIETQLESMHLPFPVVYWKASTPEDSGDFLDSTSPVPPKLQCCFRSHVKALQHFVNSKEGSHCLLLEDDVCILREGFLSKFHEALASYKANPRIDYVTLGYLPVTKANEALHTKLEMLDKDGNLYYNFTRADFTIWGSQAQLFSREAAARIVSVLHQPTAAAVLEAVEKRLTTHTSHQNKLKHVMIDALLPLLFSQAIAYPPLFVENNAPSTIHSASDTHQRNETWLRAETAGMFRLADYYSYGGTSNIIQYSPAGIKPSKPSKKIGIVIHNKANLFTNGITQNAYFMYQCLESIGHTCQFLCNEENPSPFDHKDLKLKQISLNPLVFDPSEYHTVITVTRGFGKDIYDMLKRNKVGVISFVCGNHYMVDQEEFLHGVPGGKSSFKGKGTSADELWIIPSYHHMVEYLELLTGKPGFLVPHLWSAEMIRLSAPKIIKQPEERLFYDITKRTSNKINLLILEPNLSFFKTSWMPIMAGEKLYRCHPELVEFVFAFNYPDNNHAYVMADSLTLGPKLRKFKRLSIQEILYHFNQENGCYPIFVSHQVLNTLNYLYYELLYYGFPLVHNSPDLDGCGYYYPDNNISKCVDAILYAHKHHDKGIETYKAKAREYLKRVDPLDAGVQSTFDQFVKASIVKNNR